MFLPVDHRRPRIAGVDGQAAVAEGEAGLELGVHPLRRVLRLERQLRLGDRRLFREVDLFRKLQRGQGGQLQKAGHRRFQVFVRDDQIAAGAEQGVPGLVALRFEVEPADRVVQQQQRVASLVRFGAGGDAVALGERQHQGRAAERCRLVAALEQPAEPDTAGGGDLQLQGEAPGRAVVEAHRVQVGQGAAVPPEELVARAEAGQQVIDPVQGHEDALDLRAPRWSAAPGLPLAPLALRRLGRQRGNHRRLRGRGRSVRRGGVGVKRVQAKQFLDFGVVDVETLQFAELALRIPLAAEDVDHQAAGVAARRRVDQEPDLGLSVPCRRGLFGKALLLDVLANGVDDRPPARRRGRSPPAPAAAPAGAPGRAGRCVRSGGRGVHRVQCRSWYRDLWRPGLPQRNAA